MYIIVRDCCFIIFHNNVEVFDIDIYFDLYILVEIIDVYFEFYGDLY